MAVAAVLGGDGLPGAVAGDASLRALIVAGISHLTVARQEFQAQVPDFVPLDPDVTVLASGVVEIALGLGSTSGELMQVGIGMGDATPDHIGALRTGDGLARDVEAGPCLAIAIDARRRVLELGLAERIGRQVARSRRPIVLEPWQEEIVEAQRVRRPVETSEGTKLARDTLVRARSS